MSHYPVAIFTKSGIDEIDELLRPYDEAIAVEPYVALTREQLIQREKDILQSALTGPYAKWQNDPETYERDCSNPAHIDFLKTLPRLLNQTDEQYYKRAIEGYSADRISPKGGLMSVYNPVSKWDWYVVGGRWIGMLILKDGCKGERGEPGLMTPVSENYDSALASDVDFEAISRKYAEGLQPYEQFLKNGYYTEEYMRERYPPEAEYIRRETLFQTYAVITPDGVWHAPGEMGWWAMSSETPDQARTWQDSYYDRFIKPAIDNGWYITIVDCHI